MSAESKKSPIHFIKWFNLNLSLAMDFLKEVVVKIVHALADFYSIGAMYCWTKQIISAFLLCGKMYNICVVLRMVSLLRYSKYMHTFVCCSSYV